MYNPYGKGISEFFVETQKKLLSIQKEDPMGLIEKKVEFLYGK